MPQMNCFRVVSCGSTENVEGECSDPYMSLFIIQIWKQGQIEIIWHECLLEALWKRVDLNTHAYLKARSIGTPATPIVKGNVTSFTPLKGHVYHKWILIIALPSRWIAYPSRRMHPTDVLFLSRKLGSYASNGIFDTRCAIWHETLSLKICFKKEHMPNFVPEILMDMPASLPLLGMHIFQKVRDASAIYPW